MFILQPGQVVVTLIVMSSVRNAEVVIQMKIKLMLC